MRCIVYSPHWFWTILSFVCQECFLYTYTGVRLSALLVSTTGRCQSLYAWDERQVDSHAFGMCSYQQLFYHPAWESGIKVVAMEKVIIGRIGENRISETILNYQPNIPEQESTAKKNIRNRFAAQGYNPNEVIFE